MGDKPIWEQIGSSFVQHYYHIFDTDRTQLGSLYIDASCLTWEGQQCQGKTAIVEKLSTNNIIVMPNFSLKSSAHQLFTCEVLTEPDYIKRKHQFPKYKGSISSYVETKMRSLQSLPFQKIQHSITSQDHQPTPDSCILSMVVGQLKADEDPIIGFHQIFILKNINDAWVCTNDMFRLALHNYG